MSAYSKLDRGHTKYLRVLIGRDKKDIDKIPKLRSLEAFSILTFGWHADFGEVKKFDIDSQRLLTYDAEVGHSK